ncbi:hypothetical protein BJ322DRAFT_1024325 [Thelephora terrestris]|uniref:Uncharacterized protein n=1 Tax=Thelephora terrestris TaxID=56493 RepID=A0A9P6H5E0_9AGAM|nr:hypothetical protein BJ322DRAFT_1024325 [Thelephora terrestris]
MPPNNPTLHHFPSCLHAFDCMQTTYQQAESDPTWTPAYIAPWSLSFLQAQHPRLPIPPFPSILNITHPGKTMNSASTVLVGGTQNSSVLRCRHSSLNRFHQGRGTWTRLTPGPLEIHPLTLVARHVLAAHAASLTVSLGSTDHSSAISNTLPLQSSLLLKRPAHPVDPEIYTPYTIAPLFTQHPVGVPYSPTSYSHNPLSTKTEQVVAAFSIGH